MSGGWGPTVAMVAGGAGLAALAALQHWVVLGHQDEKLKAFAAGRNWTYEPLGGAGFLGMPFEAFQVRGLDGSSRHEIGMDTWGVASLKCSLKTGTFDVVHKDMDSFYRRVGKHKIETFNAAFDRHFCVNALEEVQAKRFLSPEVTEYLALHLKDILYRLPDRFTLIWEGYLTAETAAKAADLLSGLWGVIPAELKG